MLEPTGYRSSPRASGVSSLNIPVDSKVPRRELDNYSWDQGSSPILGAIAIRGGVPLDQVGLSGTTFTGEEAVEGLIGRAWGEVMPKRGSRFQ